MFDARPRVTHASNPPLSLPLLILSYLYFGLRKRLRNPRLIFVLFLSKIASGISCAIDAILSLIFNVASMANGY